MELAMLEYDLIVIGSGPAGEKAAKKAAFFKKKVAVVEKNENFGGAGVNTGTLPSKALKQTAVYLSGKYERGLYGIERVLEKKASIDDFLYRKNKIISMQSNVVFRNLEKSNIHIYKGTASFIDSHRLLVTGEKKTKIRGKYILISTGSYPCHPSNIPFDNNRIHDSDSILNITRFPKSICILGAGVIGCEYATIFATMGIKTYLINKSDKILGFIDHDVRNALVNEMKKANIEFVFNTDLKEVIPPVQKDKELTAVLTNNKKITTDMFLFAAGRNGYTKGLRLDKIGIDVSERENIKVNEKYQTNVPNIFAVGDVIGFPSLANTGMDQGRVAVSHMINLKDYESINDILPYGIYTIPEVSMVGLTENQASLKKIPYVVGIAHCPQLPKGQLLGATYGFLKIIADKQNGTIIGVHIIGPLATEVIHYGMTLIYHKTTIYDMAGHVFNFPTLHDLYKYAAFDALEKSTQK